MGLLDATPNRAVAWTLVVVVALALADQDIVELGDDPAPATPPRGGKSGRPGPPRASCQREARGAFGGYGGGMGPSLSLSTGMTGW